MYNYVYVYFGLSKSPEHRFNSLEDAIKGIRAIHAKNPIKIEKVRFGEVQTVQWKKPIKDENGNEVWIPYDVQTRHIDITVIHAKWASSIPTTPGSQYFSIRYSGTLKDGFGQYRDIDYIYTRGHTQYRSVFMDTRTNNFSPSYDTTTEYRGIRNVMTALEKLRLENQLHSHHNGNELSEELIPSHPYA